MVVLLSGLGSIGRRHVRSLNRIAEVTVVAVRRKSSRGTESFTERYGIVEVEDFNTALSYAPDFAIIATPTAFHCETALQLAEAGIPFFLEKPVSHSMDGLDRLKKMVEEKRLPVLVGFQMRHHPGYRQVIQWILGGHIGTPLSCHGYVGQYLPDWRPGCDYRESYSAHAEMGGGVINDLCHQIDLTLSVMGNAKFVSGMCNKLSDLEIDSEDTANILIEHTGGFSHIHLNYLERTYEWYTRITGNEGTIIWDYGKGTAVCLCCDGTHLEYRVPPEFDRDVLFTEQMKHWLDVLAGNAEPVVSLVQGIDVTAIALAAKQSSKEMRHIQL